MSSEISSYRATLRSLRELDASLANVEANQEQPNQQLPSELLRGIAPSLCAELARADGMPGLTVGDLREVLSRTIRECEATIQRYEARFSRAAVSQLSTSAVDRAFSPSPLAQTALDVSRRVVAPTESEETSTQQSITVTGPDGTTWNLPITIEGDEAFRAEVIAYLETIASTEVGRRLLDQLANTDEQITILFQPGCHNAEATDRGKINPDEEGRPGDGSDVTINFDPAAKPQLGGGARGAPPVVIFFHELLHANDMANGTYRAGITSERDGLSVTSSPNSELSIIGLPYDQDGDGAPDPNRRDITENAFREELGLPLRNRHL